MKFTGLTYRPPFEASSLLLQVTSGCSHNKCSFCTMYQDVSFTIETPEQIEKDLNEARTLFPHANRVFLENGDPFVLSTDKLEVIDGMSIVQTRRLAYHIYLLLFLYFEGVIPLVLLNASPKQVLSLKPHSSAMSLMDLFVSRSIFEASCILTFI